MYGNGEDIEVEISKEQEKEEEQKEEDVEDENVVEMIREGEEGM